VIIYNIVKKEDLIMEDYKRAEVEVVEFEAADVLRASAD